MSVDVACQTEWDWEDDVAEMQLYAKRHQRESKTTAANPAKLETAAALAAKGSIAKSGNFTILRELV